MALGHRQIGLLARSVKLWIDECLSPALVGEAQRHGYEATCNRDRGMLGVADPSLLKRVVAEGSCS